MEEQHEPLRKKEFKKCECTTLEREPVYYDCTLTKFAEQINVPLYKAMEFGKYFKNKQKLLSVSEILDIICETLYPDYKLEPSIREQFKELALALAQRGEQIIKT